MDIYNPELPTIEVYAENYNIEGNRDSEWKLIKQLISTTTVSKVPKRERLQKYIPFTNRLKYGTIYVR